MSKVVSVENANTNIKIISLFSEKSDVKKVIDEYENMARIILYVVEINVKDQ